MEITITTPYKSVKHDTKDLAPAEREVITNLLKVPEGLRDEVFKPLSFLKPFIRLAPWELCRR